MVNWGYNPRVNNSIFTTSGGPLRVIPPAAKFPRMFFRPTKKLATNFNSTWVCSVKESFLVAAMASNFRWGTTVVVAEDSYSIHECMVYLYLHEWWMFHGYSVGEYAVKYLFIIYWFCFLHFLGDFLWTAGVHPLDFFLVVHFFLSKLMLKEYNIVAQVRNMVSNRILPKFLGFFRKINGCLPLAIFPQHFRGENSKKWNHQQLDSVNLGGGFNPFDKYQFIKLDHFPG